VLDVVPLCVATGNVRVYFSSSHRLVVLPFSDAYNATRFAVEGVIHREPR
jgi:hypothetical protein